MSTIRENNSSYQQNNAHIADEDVNTPTAPRGKRSDITEIDRDLFVLSYKYLLDMLDDNDNDNDKENNNNNNNHRDNEICNNAVKNS